MALQKTYPRTHYTNNLELENYMWKKQYDSPCPYATEWVKIIGGYKVLSWFGGSLLARYVPIALILSYLTKVYL